MMGATESTPQRGVQGDTGNCGFRGTGPTGVRGPTGPTGPTGVSGPTGYTPEWFNEWSSSEGVLIQRLFTNIPFDGTVNKISKVKRTPTSMEFDLHSSSLEETMHVLKRVGQIGTTNTACIASVSWTMHQTGILQFNTKCNMRHYSQVTDLFVVNTQSMGEFLLTTKWENGTLMNSNEIQNLIQHYNSPIYQVLLHITINTHVTATIDAELYKAISVMDASSTTW